MRFEYLAFSFTKRGSTPSVLSGSNSEQRFQPPYDSFWIFENSVFSLESL